MKCAPPAAMGFQKERSLRQTVNCYPAHAFPKQTVSVQHKYMVKTLVVKETCRVDTISAKCVFLYHFLLVSPLALALALAIIVWGQTVHIYTLKPTAPLM